MSRPRLGSPPREVDGDEGGRTTLRSRFGEADAIIDVLKDPRHTRALDFKVKKAQLKGVIISEKDLAKRSLTIDVVAYNMIAVSYAVYCAVTGPMGWLDGSAAKVEGSPTDRLYAESSGAMALASLTASYELYNTVTVIFLPEYATAAFIGHHACTCLLAILGMHPFLNYYGFFFFGLSAVSSVPLALTELLKVMNSTAGLELCEIVFAHDIHNKSAWLAIVIDIKGDFGKRVFELFPHVYLCFRIQC